MYKKEYMDFRNITKLLVPYLLYGLLVGCGESDDNASSEFSAFSVGGTIFSLNGEITLQLENTTAGNIVIDTTSLLINDIAAFNWSFAETISDGGDFNVVITAQPLGQICNITNNSGTINGSEFNDVIIRCTTDGEPILGMLIDSPISGVSYSTETQSGITEVDGSFLFFPGEQAQFSIGALIFPMVNANNLVTPIDMIFGMNIPEIALINIIRLLLTLDEDGEPSNGINITSQAAEIALPVNFDVTIAAFDQDPNIISLIQNAGQSPSVSSLITEQNASTHFSQSLLDNKLVFNPQFFISQIFYDVYLDNGIWNKFEFTFHQDGQFSGQFEGTNESKSGLYQFELFNRVLVLDITEGNNLRDNHKEYIVLKEFIVDHQVYSYCWIDDANVIDSVHAHQLCRHGISLDSNVQELLTGLLVFDSAQADNIIANNGKLF